MGPDGHARTARSRAPRSSRTLYEAKGITPDKDVIAYCRIGERSSHSWFVLHELLGYQRVRNYDGSWTEYGSLVGVPIEKPGGAAGPGGSRVLRIPALLNRSALGFGRIYAGSSDPGRSRTSRLRLRPPAVAGHHVHEPVVRQRVGRDPVAADHRLGGDERVDDRLLGRLDVAVEQRRR